MSRRHRRQAHRERRRFGQVLYLDGMPEVVILRPGESCPICDALGIPHDEGR